MCLPTAPISTTTTTFIFLFFFMPLFASPSPVLEEGYSHCSPYPFCGDVVNVTYPFLAGNRSSICGYPQMNLTCVNNSPQLEIESVKYRVSNIRYRDRIFTAVNIELLGTSCPRPLVDTDIGNFTFEMGNQSVPLNLLINCSLPDTNSSQELHNITCLRSHYAHPSYYLFERNESVLNETFRRLHCGKKVQVMVLSTGAEQLRNGSLSYERVMRAGFDVKWRMGAGWCTDCVESGGICGYDTIVPEQSICFCHDQYRFASCPAPGGRADARKKIIIGVSAGAGSFVLTWILFHALHFYRRKRHLGSSSSLLSRDITCPSSKSDLEKWESTSYTTHVFSYKELEEATNNFNSSREIGDGGFGTVYYGKLCDGRSVAVKRLYDNSWRKTELFMNEVKILSALRHPHLVSLYGCTSRRSRDLLLVYEYVPNGTVADHLHGHLSATSPLPWPVRLSIAAETADALAYLHAADPPVVHRDVKTDNILLDAALHVKVADFGLSRPFPAGGVTHVSTSPQGTPGYLDPDYSKCYQLTEKSDVYSYGVVLMELISSLPAVDIGRQRQEINLSTLAVNKILNQALHELVDPKLGYGSDVGVTTMIKLVSELAFRCLQQEKDMRPSMEEVLVELRNIEKVGNLMLEKEEINIFQDQVIDHHGKDENGHESTIKCSETRSPDSVMEKWVSKSTTPNASN